MNVHLSMRINNEICVSNELENKSDFKALPHSVRCKRSFHDRDTPKSSYYHGKNLDKINI